MVLLTVIIILLALPLWMLLAPIEAILDSRVPKFTIGWQTIGNASIIFEKETFWLRVHLFFMRWQWPLATLLKKRKKSKAKKISVNKSKSKLQFHKVIQVLNSIRVKQCELSLRPDDNLLAAQLYFLNFIVLPHPYKLSVGFTNDSYLLLQITTAPWRIVYAWLRN